MTDAPGPIQTIENVLLGPIVALLTFVCSVGNVPLAVVLWGRRHLVRRRDRVHLRRPPHHSADPHLPRYYGRRVTLRLVAIMFVSMAAAALAVDAIFGAADLIPSARPSIDSVAEREIGWNYTTFLNIVFFAVAAALLALTLRRGARDPVCGMTVARSTAHRSEREGRTVFFCSAGCKAKFERA